MSLFPINLNHKASAMLCSEDNREINFLDSIHAIAVENHIVTPYSSMIVLINERQRKALELASNQKRRFDRPAENPTRNIRPDRRTNIPGLFSISGVPEPEEWILIIVACSLLTVIYLRKYKKSRA